MKTHPQPGTIDEVNLTFKKLIRKAATHEEEERIRVQWNEARAAYWATHTADSIEQVDEYFRSLYAHAPTDAEKGKVRVEWAEAKADYFERLYKGSGSSPSTPAAEPVVAASEDLEAEAIEAARNQYGEPAVGGSGAMKHIYADPPTPIEIHWPTVEIITDEEGV